MSSKMHQFSQYLRGTDSTTHSGREKIYYHLVRANLHEVLAHIYPRVINYVGAENWAFLLDEFLHQHAAATPYFYQLPDEFLSFLWHNKAHYGQWPWLWSLAHFEWMELVATVADEPLPEPNTALLRCSPLAYYCQYDYAVHPLDKEYTALERRAQPWQGVVYRNRKHLVHWFALETWPALLLQTILQYKECSIEDTVHHLMQQGNNAYQEDAVRESVVAWCDTWRKLDILV
ncbi:MAG: hypothetical protein K0R48_376 [Gammaproteobacteria bacterium]|nr:hypothetical protein [Gammaproteobacteria bacterium]